MNCKLRIVGACAALGLPCVAAGSLLAVPTIDVSSPTPSAGTLAVVFAPPALSNSPTLRPLTIQVGLSDARTIAPDAAISDNTLPARFPSRAADQEPASSAHPRAFAGPNGTHGGPTIAFAVPRYEVPAYQVTSLERDTLAACLVLEAASQGEFGMRAVMAVIRNRAGGDPQLFAPVVLQPKQFSALNKVTAGGESLYAAIRRAKRDRVWDTALAVVDDAIEGKWHDPTGGATHYTRSAERTHWTRSLAKTTTIGAHSFYR